MSGLSIPNLIFQQRAIVGRNAEPNVRLEYPEPDFPATGNKVEDIIPPDYHIDMEANGDLNHDGIEDKVRILAVLQWVPAGKPN